MTRSASLDCSKVPLTSTSAVSVGIIIYLGVCTFEAAIDLLTRGPLQYDRTARR